jgi:undecaprenyl diphosphate synthase
MSGFIFIEKEKIMSEEIKLPHFDILPEHLGIIMDGNGRWAEKRGLERSAGHKEGARVFKKTADYCQKIGIKYLTVYAFSTENWKRPQKEVHALMELFDEYLDWAISQEKENEEKGVRISFFGDETKLPEELQGLIEYVQNHTKDKNKFFLNIAVNYGGRAEITRAAKILAEKVKNGEIKPEDITEKMISDNLYTADMPDPDLIIRPSGEERLSNFMTWQSAYSEFWFSDVLWPDFTEETLNEALFDFEKRHRRFGGV